MFTLTRHAEKQAEAKGMDLAAILEAANYPSVTYANGRFPGQMRHIKGGIVAVVDVASERIVTVYINITETGLRPDQTDRDARAFGLRRAGRRG